MSAQDGERESQCFRSPEIWHPIAYQRDHVLFAQYQEVTGLQVVVYKHCVLICGQAQSTDHSGHFTIAAVCDPWEVLRSRHSRTDRRCRQKT